MIQRQGIHPLMKFQITIDANITYCNQENFFSRNINLKGDLKPTKNKDLIVLDLIQSLKYRNNLNFGNSTKKLETKTIQKH